jgi:hypothetical protein
MDGTDDLGWLCSWGGDPLLEWERLDLYASDPAVVELASDPDVVEMVDYWLWKEAVHVELSDLFLRTEDPIRLFFLHMYVQEIRARSDRARKLGLRFTLPP